MSSHCKALPVLPFVARWNSFTALTRSKHYSLNACFVRYMQRQSSTSICLDLLAVQVCWSDDGERFSGLGDGGVVATWRLDAPRMQASDTGYLGRSDWGHQVLQPPSSTTILPPCTSLPCHSTPSTLSYSPQPCQLPNSH